MFGPGGPTFLELTVEALSSIEKGYDLLAPKFNKTPYRTPEELLEQGQRFLEPGGHLLDVGAGTGAAAPFFYPKFDQVTALDLSREMLNQISYEPLERRHQDALTLDEHDLYDAAITFGAIGHFLTSQQHDLFLRIRRALKPGGILLTVTAERARFPSKRFLFSHTFNAALWVRNQLFRPTFVMYYETFHLARVRRVLDEVGFSTEFRRGVFSEPFEDFILVLAKA